MCNAEDKGRLVNWRSGSMHASVIEVRAGEEARVLRSVARLVPDAELAAARARLGCDVRWLDTVIDCPDAVKAALMREVHIQDMLVIDGYALTCPHTYTW
ncbi:hypothetical protein EON66_00415 [archaeon]|nr:MAG: hypothetical protein EON66_00415 [archaeon]